MKKAILIVLTVFFFSGCGLYKKTEKNRESVKKSETTTKMTRDSSSVINRTAPSESEITFDLSDLSKIVGDFEQRISSGNGTESVVSKKDGKLTIRNNNAGSTDTKTNVDKNKSETIYTSEFLIQETKKVISRLPWWIWLAVGIWLLIVFRKFIAQLLMIFFPASAILKIFTGSKP